MDWDGSDVRRLETDIPARTWAFAHQPWSPDGHRIATHDGNGSQSVWLVDVDETGALEDVRKLGAGLGPKYAPDGRLRWVMSKFSTIVVVMPEQLQSTMVLVNDIYEDVWSPDGQRFAGVIDGQLATIDHDGEGVAFIAPGAESAPAWQRVAE